MAKDNSAWFEANALQVDNFDFEDCPHGQLQIDPSDEPGVYRCTICDMAFKAEVRD